jgi:Fe-S cluster assembly scaffold protein SufB
MRSRGIDAVAARDLLSRGFASEIADRIPNQAVRDEVLTLIGARLGAESGVDAPVGDAS